MNKILLLSLILCSHLSHAKLNVFTCEPEWAALANALGGDQVKVFSATHGKQDPHYIQARPSLIAKVRKADLLICTGAELEIGWLPLLLRKSANKKIQPGKTGYFIATSMVRLLDKPRSIDRSQGDVHASGNPHVQADPRKVAEIAKQLSIRMQQLDADNAEYYKNNSEDFLARWDSAIIKWQQQAQALKGRKIIAHHKSWIYLTNWLGMEIIAYLEPKPGVAPTAEHLSRLIKVSKNEQPDIIIYAAYQNPKSAKWLEKRTGIKAIELPFTIGGSKAATDLFGFFDDTLKRLLGAVE
jgi:zinc/manganese transport system substrate-binding protein